jgi:transcription antitermination factor NusG
MYARRRGTVGEHSEHIPYLHPGEQVHILEGPFAGYDGVVVEVDDAGRQVRVAISFFGRVQVLPFDISQVEPTR